MCRVMGRPDPLFLVVAVFIVTVAFLCVPSHVPCTVAVFHVIFSVFPVCTVDVLHVSVAVYMFLCFITLSVSFLL